MSTIRGKTSATENRIEFRFGPNQADEGSYTVQGPRDAILQLLPAVKAAGYEGVYVSDASPIATLVYRIAGRFAPGDPVANEVPTPVWEYFANRSEIDILETDIAAVNGISDADKRAIRNAIANPDPDTAPTLSSANATNIYKLMLGGLRSYQVTAGALKVTRIVSGTYQTKATLTNAGRVLSTATLQTQESIPAGILFNLPASSTTTRNGLEFVYGWLKQHPTISQIGGNRWNVSQEWNYGLYPTLIYQAML